MKKLKNFAKNTYPKDLLGLKSKLETNWKMTKDDVDWFVQ